jgi:general nucleoside transport system permease protein
MIGDQVIQTFASGVALMAPILWAALGELIAEQGGVLNIGLEGIMLISAIVSAMVALKGGGLELSVLAGVAGGILCGVLLSYFYVVRGMDQIVTGILFNILAVGLAATIYTSQKYIGGGVVQTFERINVPGLADIPALGKIFFQQDILIYCSFLAVPVVWYLMQHTWFGLYLRSAGEFPSATEAGGISVWAVRIPAVILASAFGGMAGATLVMSIIGGSFVIGLTAGRGFIALAVVVLARWNPFALVIAALLFGTAQALQFTAGSFPGFRDMPREFWLMVPYLLVVIAVFFARGSRYPAAVGVPHLRPRRSRIATWIIQRFGTSPPMATAEPRD